MNGDRDRKVTAHHLTRDACLYVRQALPHQGFENDELMQRQYNLRQQAMLLGWPVEKVIVIDSDTGQSGASLRHRPGFQRLLRQIELGRVGIVMALEPSRLTRTDRDWHRLVDACAVSETLLLDQCGLYDPGDSHDRRLLGCAEMTPTTAESCRFGKEARL